MDLGTQLLDAAGRGDAAAVARLLAAGAPLTATDRSHRTALEAAAHRGHVDVMQLLLAEGASAARICRRGRPALFWAAVANPASEQAVRLLLAAAPEMAAQPDWTGHTPLFYAALHGHAAAARAIGEAATAAAPLPPRNSPFGRALWVARQRARIPFKLPALAGAIEAAQAILPFTTRDQALSDLAEFRELLGTHLHPLYAAAVARWPLSAEQWQLLPSPCAGLAALLPAVLRRSEAEAALLVAHLPPTDRQRLRTAALCLHRTQQRARVELPTALVWHVLALALAA